MQVQWCEWPGFTGASIATKQLLPIIIAKVIWGASVLCHCDNQATVMTVRGEYGKNPALAHLLLCLFFLEAKFNLTLTAGHIPGKGNGTADSLSRNNLSSFFPLVPQAHCEPCSVPENLVRRMVTECPWTSDIWKAWLGTLSTTH